MNFIYKKIYHPASIQLDYDFDSKGKINIEELIAKISSKNGLQMLGPESPSGFTGQGCQIEFEKILNFCNLKILYY